MPVDRRTVGLSLLAATVVALAVVQAAYMPVPASDIRHGFMLTLLVIAGGMGGFVLIWTWRMRPHSQLRLARRELMDAVELAAVMVLDEDGMIRHWSRGCEELYGWSATHALGRNRNDLLGTQRTMPLSELAPMLREQGEVGGEVIERHRDGRELIVHESIKLFEHPDGRMSGVLALNDVTDQRHAENALRLSEARLATAVAVQGIFIYEYDLLTDRPVWMTAGEPFFLGDADATPEWQWDAAQSAQIRELVDAAVAGGQDRHHYDFDFSYPDGTPRRGEGWARIIRDRAGRPVRMLATHLDVTERRQREQALRTGEAERHAILSTVPDAMFVCGEGGVIRACSASASKLFGHEERALTGRNLIELIKDGRGRTAAWRDIEAACDHGDGWSLPVSVECADGGKVPVSFVAGRTTIDGELMYVVVGRDMRPTIAGEEKYHRLSNELAQVSRLGMMGEMAAVLAHELSQPLSAIVNFLGAADLMLEADEVAQPERLRHAIHAAADQSSRAGEIIRRLRAFILRGEADMRAEPLVSLIREAAALALFNTSSFGVRLVYDFEHEQRLVLGDRVQIQQVLVNLIRNGADAIAAQGGARREMVITTRLATDNLIEVAVRDSGPGIAPEMLEKLFSPFATTKREGLGFGLAISRRIVEAHGGQLSAVSAPDGGAIFRFTLPVMEAEETSP